MVVNRGSREVSLWASMIGQISCAVSVPCSFWPPRSSFSMSAQLLLVPAFTQASAHFRLRPPKQVVMRSATPQLSRKVLSFTDGWKCRMKVVISSSPIRMMAALVLLPNCKPSQKPAPRATTFLRAPQSSTPAMSDTARTRKVGQSKSLTRSCWSFSDASVPKVASQNCSSATSLATFAPMSTETLCLSSLRSTSEHRPILPPSSSRPPLMRLTDIAPSLTGPMLETVLGTNWCGNTHT
mmetsp:Transcript_106195/g.288186  ORF Transcript_106195/g.288186 Transcript_106195/m.288186 type:complete len:239 (+) Transcript_106195:222-938(+)